jgi:hypothetical protein
MADNKKTVLTQSDIAAFMKAYDAEPTQALIDLITLKDDVEILEIGSELQNDLEVYDSLLITLAQIKKSRELLNEVKTLLKGN